MDRTTTAVARQLRAMGCSEVEAGARESATGRMILKIWTVAELIGSIPWLKARNAAGWDIFVRPNGPTPLVLLDDLTLGRVRELGLAGLSPCCVTQTSPSNYQAWIRLGNHPLAPEVLTVAAKLLAKRFCGDPASATQRHFGRLAGFTNQKPNRRDDQGRAPFVLLEVATGASAVGGAAMLQEAARIFQVAQTVPSPREPATPTEGLPDPVTTFLDGLARLRQAFGAAFNPSIADWEVASGMAARGFTRDQIEAALRQSPELEQRKRGHIEAYVATTMAKLWQEGGGS